MKQKASILVVDDEAGIRKTLSKILEREGYFVKTAENGKDAIKALRTQPFDIALVDIRLPDIDGIELLDQMWKIRPRLVKIIVTGFPSLNSAVDALDKGADGYVLKPFDVSELLAMIKKRLRKRKEDEKYDEKKIATFIETRAREVKAGMDK